MVSNRSPSKQTSATFPKKLHHELIMHTVKGCCFAVNVCAVLCCADMLLPSVVAVQDKFMKLVPHVDDGRQRLAYDIPAADLQSIYGYPQGAPDLVLSMLDRCACDCRSSPLGCSLCAQNLPTFA